MYKLYLVNNTRFEYIEACQSDFSQARSHFAIPPSWNGSEDDMEMMTEFVFKEKLKHRRRYVIVEMFPEPISDDEDDDAVDIAGIQEKRIRYASNSPATSHVKSSRSQEEDLNIA
jgi:hypothetical protein